jgi:hyaluronate lyase
VSWFRRSLVIAVISLATAGAAVAASITLTSAHLTTFAKVYGSPTTCTLGPSADTYVFQLLASNNFGTATTLDVASTTAFVKQTFIRFDLSGCSPPIPTGAIVQSAALKLTVSALAASTRTYVLKNAAASWSETTLTWSNAPAVAATATASATVTVGTAAGTVVQWSVVSDVQSFVTAAATNNGWRLGDSAEGSGISTLSFGSREAATGRPQLVITYVS